MVHFIVMGCGRVGAATATALEGRGHTVAVIDQEPAAFRRLPPGFGGQRVTGPGFDREILRQAGIADAYGFAAVSSGDNSNVLAARVVRETFGIDNVVARIYDPDRAEVYQRLGIATVATVPWAADQVLRAVLPAGAAGEYQDPTGHLTLVRFDLHPDWIGTDLTVIEEAVGGRVAFLSRFGQAILPTSRTVYQSGDLVYLMLPTDQMLAAERTLARAPEAES
ncbi:MAG: TrkA family potassium uptake protein [Bifidobacteriaceae bacterium]|jgi:trk system potassium uptake protein TrkA|nr:TrkA family potassium uptake protein [Bifidobacteriaceae bacterium]